MRSERARRPGDVLVRSRFRHLTDAQMAVSGQLLNGGEMATKFTMMPTILVEHLPNAHLRIYPDADHGFLYQYPELFGDHVRTFLNAK
jgi:pimeloyl-ACP methyl ester carboxylesterase